MRPLKKALRKLLPESLISAYHFSLAEIAAFLYRHPSRGMLVIAVTGTKGKSSVTEMAGAILEEARYETAILNSIREKIGPWTRKNAMRMSMPGRFYLQNFLSKAYRAECDAVILEMTSEGVKQHRHRGIALDALIFTNLAPEHIESHGSLRAYADAKFQIGKALVRSKKGERIMVANADDAESARYLALPVEKSLPFSLEHAKPWRASAGGGFFTFHGEKITVHLPGEFSLKNALAAATLTHAIGVDTKTIARAIGKITKIPGRAERIEAGQNFDVVVDYAHTPDSLTALYEAYKEKRKICVLGATGGGSDKWKRPVMGEIADTYCDVVIATNEDPYDEDPRDIVDELVSGMKRAPEIIMDRREAISRAFEIALSWSKGRPLDTARGNQNGIAVLITGKGTDPTIQGKGGSSIPWSDAAVAKEELEKRSETNI